MITLLAIGLGVSIASDAYFFQERRFRRSHFHGLALERARQSGKPLLVVGAPDGWNAGRGTYECGDLPCIDLDGCKRCGSSPFDLDKSQIPLPDNFAVVFVSCVLEYVRDVRRVYSELERVSGGDLFIVHIQPECALTYQFYRPRANHKIISAPPLGEFSHKPNGLDSRSIMSR